MKRFFPTFRLSRNEANKNFVKSKNFIEQDLLELGKMKQLEEKAISVGLSYAVVRTINKQLPVYYEGNSTGSRSQTIIKRIHGDIPVHLILN